MSFDTIEYTVLDTATEDAMALWEYSEFSRTDLREKLIAMLEAGLISGEVEQEDGSHPVSSAKAREIIEGERHWKIESDAQSGAFRIFATEAGENRYRELAKAIFEAEEGP